MGNFPYNWLNKKYRKVYDVIAKQSPEVFPNFDLDLISFWKSVYQIVVAFVILQISTSKNLQIIFFNCNNQKSTKQKLIS